jgi:hypothetical protein
MEVYHVKHRSIIFIAAGVVFALALGWIVFPAALYDRIEQPVQFSHAIHAGETVGMGCQDCHAIRDDGTFEGIPTLEKCKTCHQEAVGTSDAEKNFVENYVKQNREVPWLVYARQPDNTYFSHVQHVKEAGLTCERCHGPHGTSTQLRPYFRNRVSGYSRDIWGASISGVKSQPWEGMKMADCIQCHNGSNKLACIDCHK